MKSDNTIYKIYVCSTNYLMQW